MLNRVTLQGRMVAGPELRHTQSNVAVASFRLAVERDTKDKETGERKADFINCTAWKGTAELAARYFSKGSMAIVEGKLQTREYTDKEGARRFATEVIVSSIYFCGSKQSGGTGGSKPANSYGNQYGGGFTEISGSDELPF